MRVYHNDRLTLGLSGIELGSNFQIRDASRYKRKPHIKSKIELSYNLRGIFSEGYGVSVSLEETTNRVWDSEEHKYKPKELLKIDHIGVFYKRQEKDIIITLGSEVKRKYYNKLMKYFEKNPNRLGSYVLTFEKEQDLHLDWIKVVIPIDTPEKVKN